MLIVILQPIRMNTNVLKIYFLFVLCNKQNNFMQVFFNFFQIPVDVYQHYHCQIKNGKKEAIAQSILLLRCNCLQKIHWDRQNKTSSTMLLPSEVQSEHSLMPKKLICSISSWTPLPPEKLRFHWYWQSKLMLQYLKKNEPGTITDVTIFLKNELG
jgi:hypothetical protein